MAPESLTPAPKTCVRCHEVKPADAFSPRSTSCRICNYAHVKAWRRKYPERHRAGVKATQIKNPEKARAQRKAWRLKNPEKAHASQLAYRRKHAAQNRATVKAWRLKNPEKYRATKRAWGLQNAEHIRAKNRAWRLQNAEKHCAHSQMYRARKLQAAVNDLTAQQWEEIKAAFKHCCAYCGRKMQRLTQDHITPLIAGGNHTKQNIVPACRSCNSRKGKGAPLVPVQPLLL